MCWNVISVLSDYDYETARVCIVCWLVTSVADAVILIHSTMTMVVLQLSNFSFLCPWQVCGRNPTATWHWSSTCQSPAFCVETDQSERRERVDASDRVDSRRSIQLRCLLVVPQWWPVGMAVLVVVVVVDPDPGTPGPRHLNHWLSYLVTHVWDCLVNI